MTFEKTGGPAFPATVGPGGSEVQIAPGQWVFPGLTVRDYFAAKAMEAILSNPNNKDPIKTELAFHCYLISDEMMKARDA